MKTKGISTSISKKISFLVVGGVITFLSLGLIVFLSYSENQKLKTANEAIDELSHSMEESITFAMAEGITDVSPFIKRMKVVNNIKDLRIVPTKLIDESKAEEMDAAEREIVESKSVKSETEEFQNLPVLRAIRPIKAEENCLSCHEGKAGDVFAVMSIRYSLEETEAAIMAERISGAVVILFLVAFIGLFLIYLIKKNILTDLFQLIQNIKELSLGNLNTLVTCRRKDEFGKLADSINVLLANWNSQAATVHEFANGNFDAEVKLLSENDTLGKSVREIKDSLTNLTDDTLLLSGHAESGNLSLRANEQKHKGLFKTIISGFNSTFEYLTAPIKESSGILARYANGDFTARMTGNYKGEHQQLKNDINRLGDSLSDLIGKIIETVQATASASNQISSSTEQMAAGAQEQSSQTSEIASAVEQMTKSIYETSKNTSLASDASKSAGKTAKDGGMIVEETVRGMIRIAEVVRSSAEKVIALGQSSKKIGEIVQVIDDIADQTNLLALNAAIEAARAGDHGKGFAVVADEVLKLAERTTKATKEIANMITHIQKDTSQAVEAMQIGNAEVEKGRLSAEHAGKSLKEIIDGSDKVVDLVSQVAAASEEQSATAEQISKNIESISNVTQESASGIQQIANAAEDLNKLTFTLQDLVGKFVVDNSYNRSNLSRHIKEKRTMKNEDEKFLVRN
ncbi:MAG: HAMP domain-containing protein [Ignavibacteriaceae bacterium]|nr:HAMP domain-containing protein [Ignavibacteriaceae bacterium]